jgi:16S rRNA (cytidine1402-2'-O)-methyltransferase
VVGTPIGRRSDLSIRAAEVLAEVSTIACEDTRTARKLLDPLGIQTPLVPYHDHNEKAQAERLADQIAAGSAIAVISDAGMPAISDPGFRLVKTCRVRGLPVFAIPGPTALTTALAVSGLPTDKFFYFGFLPPKSAARRRTFTEHATADATLVFYESTHRILKFLDDVVDVLGSERVVCVARELTKLFETVHTGPADQVREALQKGSSKGEFVVMIAKADYEL